MLAGTNLKNVSAHPRRVHTVSPIFLQDLKNLAYKYKKLASPEVKSFSLGGDTAYLIQIESFIQVGHRTKRNSASDGDAYGMRQAPSRDAKMEVERECEAGSSPRSQGPIPQ